MHFDYKQSRIISSWYKLGQQRDGSDNYMSFISYWIAFNAICYNLYHRDCTIERANIDRKKSKLNRLKDKLKLTNNIEANNAYLLLKDNDRWNIDLSFPDRLFFSIEKKYTEDLVYDRFVKEYTEWYELNPIESSKDFKELQNSLLKPFDGKERSFIINMTRVHEYRRLRGKNKIEEMHQKSIVILCENNRLNIVKKILYQIRCNIFHGEKVPGDINDDRIVSSALPLLKHIVKHLIKDNEIEINF